MSKSEYFGEPNMTHAKTPILTTTLLIGSCFLILTIPAWVVMPMLGCTLLLCLLHSTLKNTQLWLSMRAFLLEFCGFCCLVASFTGTMVAMYGLLFS
jgi:hypothetical protein